MKGLNELGQEIYANAKSKGFYDDGKAQNIGERLCLIHSEVSEALEADRKNRYTKSNIIDLNNVEYDSDFVAFFNEQVKDTHEDEMADILIRVLDHCAFKGIDIEQHVKAKMRYNSTREKLHGKKY